MIAVAMPSRSPAPLGRTLAVACAMVWLLSACSLRGNAAGSAVHSGAAAPAPPAASHPAATPGADMVAAVSSGKTSLPVAVKFELRQRPEAGQPAELDLLIIPSAPLDRLMTSFHAEQGLALRDGGQPGVAERLEPGVPIARKLTIVPQQDGIYYVDATVLADWSGESIGHTFTIPVIAGAGVQ
jgi:hypothetical protein